MFYYHDHVAFFAILILIFVVYCFNFCPYYRKLPFEDSFHVRVMTIKIFGILILKRTTGKGGRKDQEGQTSWDQIRRRAEGAEQTGLRRRTGSNEGNKATGKLLNKQERLEVKTSMATSRQSKCSRTRVCVELIAELVQLVVLCCGTPVSTQTIRHTHSLQAEVTLGNEVTQNNRLRACQGQT